MSKIGEFFERQFYPEIAKLKRAKSPKSEDQHNDFMISDERIRGTLQRFAPGLMSALTDSRPSFSFHLGLENKYASQMTAQQVDLWERHFGLVSHTRDAVKEGSLVVPDFTFDNSFLEKQGISADGRRIYQIDYDRYQDPRKNGIQLDTKFLPVTPVTDPTKLTYLVKPEIYFNKGFGDDKLYSAGVDLKTYVQDENGIFAMEGGFIPENESGWNGIRELRPFVPASGDLNFNIKFEPDKSNTLKADRITAYRRLVLHCEIHDPERLEDLQIPDDPKLRFWFWQLDQLMTNTVPRLSE